MKVKDLEWSGPEPQPSSGIAFYAKGDYGRFTVVDREIGWSGCRRDTETGYQDTRGRFWLVSGMFDIRDYHQLAVEEAIALVKALANTCVGEECHETD